MSKEEAKQMAQRNIANAQRILVMDKANREKMKGR